MATLRFQPRLALLDLELRRLWREPWLAYASLMLLPLAFTFLFSSARNSSAPGADLFGVLVWWWCLAAHVVLPPLMGLAFRGEDKRDELEALQVAGFSGLSLCAGLLGSRLVTALAVLLIPMPVVILCYLLGGLSGAGLQAACLHLPAHFLFSATSYAFLGIALPSTTGFWSLSLVFASLQLFPFLPAPLLAGASNTVALAMGGRSMPGQDPVLWQLGCAAALGLASVLGLGLRLRRGTLAGESQRQRRAWAKPGTRPSIEEPIRWKEHWFALGGSAGRWVRLGWSPAVVIVLTMFPALLLPRKNSTMVYLMISCVANIGMGLLLSLAHGVWGAHRLFAREFAGQTMDDLVLARGWAFGVIREKLEEYRRCNQELWKSAMGGIGLSLVILLMATPRNLWVGLVAFIAFMLVVMPIAGFLIFRFQECFVVDLFRHGSNPDGMPTTALVREGSRFAALFMVYLIVIPWSLIATVATSILAFVFLPLLVDFWFRYFRKKLILKQRQLLEEICLKYEDPDYKRALNLHYPAPPARKRSPFLYP